MSWDGERVELLRKLWQEGISASRIAAQLGAGITRNAVIGKVHRLGLAGRAKPAFFLGRAPSETRGFRAHDAKDCGVARQYDDAQGNCRRGGI